MNEAVTIKFDATKDHDEQRESGVLQHALMGLFDQEVQAGIKSCAPTNQIALINALQLPPTEITVLQGDDKAGDLDTTNLSVRNFIDLLTDLAIEDPGEEPLELSLVKIEEDDDFFLDDEEEDEDLGEEDVDDYDDDDEY